MDNDENMDLMLSDEELEKLGISFHEPTPEEIEEKRINRAKELESKGFLPENAELNETMSSPQELVETNPRRFIIEECIPACQELWSKNIYTFMVSDHLNEGQCWIEIIVDGLSDENKEVFMNLSGDDVIKFSYHRGTINFGVKLVGKEGQSRLLELAQQFQMQDVPINQSYISMQDFLLEYCGCYDEIPNPNYIEMKPAWEMELSVEQIADYMQKMGFELKNPRNWTYATPDIYLSDMHDENVIRSNKSDTFFVVDCDIRINTPELRQGGTRTLSTDVHFID